MAEHLGQIAPGRSRAYHPQHRLQEESVIRSRTAGITGLAGQQRRDTLPLFILQDQTIQD
jgi:hypothetical protein